MVTRKIDDDDEFAKNKRQSERRGGLHAAWAIIVTESRVEVPCWILDESRTGVGLETRKQFSPCPLEVGGTYWMQIKPSHSKTSSWVAGTVKHVREKTVGSGIYRIGIKMTTVPPASLGTAPEL